MLKCLQKLLGGKKAVSEAGKMNLYKYKFLRFKEERNKKYPLDISKIHIPCQKGLVSVVLPVYNGREYLAQSIQSVLDQTYRNFELIIVNDGSVDGSLELAREFEKKDSRIRVLTQENQKIPKTLSRGFGESMGEFLTWTSADNIMDSNFLEKMVEELNANPKTAMVWANMRLINGKSGIRRCHGWYEYPLLSGNVMLPRNAFELNTYANNTIGAAFMYRRVAMTLLGDYSPFRYTLEDYDYWMRLNSLLELRHTSFDEPIYSYRWHKASLTAKDKELGITQNRTGLMIFDDFRRDFYLTPLNWYVVSDENNRQTAEEFKRLASEAGCVVLEKNDFGDLFFGKGLSNIVCICFGDSHGDVNLPSDTLKVGVNVPSGCEESFDFRGNMGFDGEADETQNGLKILSLRQNGLEYCGFEDAQNLFSFVDGWAKNCILSRIEERVEKPKPSTTTLSVVVCTHRLSETLGICLDALCNQTADAKDYEIVFVNNDFRNKKLKEFVQDFRVRYENVKINYITAPVKGLSYARNCGLWASGGEYILFVDDDAVARKDIVRETIKVFEEHKDMGVCGGQILLNVPKVAKELVNERTGGLWSNFEIKGDAFRFAKDYGEFPYGANFAVCASALRKVGGFRCAYGRVDENYAGGEETVACFMMNDMGMKVGLNPNSVVAHLVSEERFTREHMEKTISAGILIQYNMRRDLYAPQDWTEANVNNRANRALEYAQNVQCGSADDVMHRTTAWAFGEVIKLMRDDKIFLKRKNYIYGETELCSKKCNGK